VHVAPGIERTWKFADVFLIEPNFSKLLASLLREVVEASSKQWL
jgi:hypothetical protein